MTVQNRKYSNRSNRKGFGITPPLTFCAYFDRNYGLKKTSLLGIALIILGTGFAFLSMISFVEIQASIEYFKTLLAGSSQPGLDYGGLYSFIIISSLLIPSGIIIYLKSNR